MIYRRRFDPDSGDSLARLARWLTPGATVLELGAAAGYFTEWMRGRGCTVDVVELDPEAARAARPFARRVVVADLDAEGWEAALRQGAGEGEGAPRYDFIVCADVLEHLRDGVRLLARLRPLLAPGGELLLSVPNVAHAAVIAGLLDDRFEYGGEGLLDPTHLRLYTWRSLAAGAARRRIRDPRLGRDRRDAVRQRVPHAGRGAAAGAARAAGTGHAPPDVPVAGARRAGADGRAAGAAGAGGRRAGAGAAAACGPPRRVLARGDPARFHPGQRRRDDAGFRVRARCRGAATGARRSRRRGDRRVVRATTPASANCGVAAPPGDEVDAGPDAIPIDADRYALVRNDAWIEPRLEPGRAALVDRARVTLRWTGDWAGAAALAALTGLAEAYGSRQAVAQREIDWLKEMVEERDAAIAARDARVADSLATLAGAERTLAAARDALARREARSRHAARRPRRRPTARTTNAARSSRASTRRSPRRNASSSTGRACAGGSRCPSSGSSCCSSAAARDDRRRRAGQADDRRRDPGIQRAGRRRALRGERPRPHARRLPAGADRRRVAGPARARAVRAPRSARPAAARAAAPTRRTSASPAPPTAACGCPTATWCCSIRTPR